MALVIDGETPYTRVKQLMAALRNPNGGCPWDLEQDFASIIPYTIEEAYEVADAVTRGDMDELKNELGDLLLQVVFHSQMASELGHFNLDDVADGLVNKMVSRHPHVFGDESERTAQGQTLAWEEIKAAERKAKGQDEVPKSVLADVALALPALMRAEKLQKRAARVGFDWPDTDGVLDKIVEEAQEVTDAAASGNMDAIEDEIGDLLFAVTNLSRKLGIDPEVALRRTNDKFTRRFMSVEAGAKASARDVSDMSLDEMESLWIAAKHAEKTAKKPTY